MRKPWGSIGRVLIYIVFATFTVTNIFPIVWVVISSFKTNSEFAESLLSFPRHFDFTNYLLAWKTSKIGVYFLNSVYVSVVSMSIVVALSIMVAYILARYQFAPRNMIYVFFIFGMLIPIHTTLVPLFIMFKTIHALDKWFTLILPYTGFGLPFAVFILESFIRTIPRELDEAAIIDGCGSGSLLLQIITPLCKPALATVCIMTFLTNWNDFVFPLIFINKDRLKTIQLGLANFIGPRSADYTQLMAGLVISIIPILVLYFTFQNSLVKGMTAGAVKG